MQSCAGATFIDFAILSHISSFFWCPSVLSLIFISLQFQFLCLFLSLFCYKSLQPQNFSYFQYYFGYEMCERLQNFFRLNHYIAGQRSILIAFFWLFFYGLLLPFSTAVAVDISYSSTEIGFLGYQTAALFLRYCLVKTVGAKA